MASRNFFKHWPTMLLGLIVALVLLTAVFSYQLNQTEVAVVTTFGRPEVVSEPGLHFRWPFPFQKVYRFDNRIRCYEGSSGKLEETVTKDGHNIIAGVYVNYRISDVKAFFSELQDVTRAEDIINSQMRSAKSAAFSQRDFDQIVNADPKKLQLDAIISDIKKSMENSTEKYGIEIVGVGINSLGVPKTVSEKVFERMIAERKQYADENLARGKSEAKEIRAKADAERDKIIAAAEANALILRGQADAQAADYYKNFEKAPELAQFLRKLEALRLILKGRTTIVVDTSMQPFDMLTDKAVIPGVESGAASK